MLAALIIGPWLLALVYDLILYLWRVASHEFPYVGGRARGQERPRAPSLKERPDGHRRGFSFTGMPRASSEHNDDAIMTETKRESVEPKYRATYETSLED